MSFSGRKTWVLPLFLVVISFLHILNPGQTKAAAIRTSPQHIMEPPSPEKNPAQAFREYFNGRASSDLDSRRNGTFFDSKRRIPSCPDPLHN
ncbi:Clavata3/esr-related 43 [Dorcoceras hygrometricum]|uniref:Clavata3/esr-related 43 n=1 Tax=Dorcoceras hygrometricum TaxID=472368 RepID=A0A2Z7CTB0_9LAMI|nr:Clavata3/esr-related 43 [Dorcoceras hygrometricum]